jgi:signal transduction histidine kinase
MGLLLYSHVPTSLIALVFGCYVLWKARNLPAFLFFTICLTFTLWAAFDLSAWFSFLGSTNTMFVWSLLDFLAVLMFFFTYYFLYTFVTGKDLPLWQKVAGIVVLLPTTIVAVLGINIPTYDLNSCTALENNAYTIYTYISEALYLLGTIVFLVGQYWKNDDPTRRNRTVLAGTGVLIFLGFFFSATLLVSLFASSDASSYVYNYLIYGLFGMPVFLIYFGYLIVRYHAFRLKMFGAQALIVALIAVLASQFAFVITLTSRILVAVTVILTSIVGAQLIRSVKLEIEQRKEIEKLAQNLEAANGQLSEFMSLATHEIRNPATVIKGVSANALEGDLGVLLPIVKDAFQKIFIRANDVISLGNQYMDKSKLELHQLAYTFTPFDLGNLMKDIVSGFQPSAEQHNVTVVTDMPAGQDFTVEADQGKLKEVIGNLIDNSIKYNVPKGSVTVSILKVGETITVKIADTGAGIAANVIPKLFKKFSRADAEQANLLGTGLGLYLAKIFIDAHHGRIWVESEGKGRGSTFFVELPVKQAQA